MGRRHLYGRRRFRARFRGTNIVSDTLTVTDNRTGKKYELPIQDGTIRAMDLRQIKSGPEDFGLR